jgi:phosphoenolpyruvate-protein kinase (PTS system EI component)
VRRWTGVGEVDTSPLPPSARPAAVEQATVALAAAAAELAALAAGLGEADAEIIATGVLMASDPALLAAVVRAIVDAGLPAPAAILAATEGHGTQLAALDDPLRAARAADIRSLGHRAARLAMSGGHGAAASPPGGVIVAHDLGPADVAELGSGISAIALAGGGATGHAAIVARSLGIPMVVGVGDGLLGVAEGEEVVVDGDAGRVIAQVGGQSLEAARTASAARRRAAERAIAMSALPAITRDGARVSVLANVASQMEVGSALAAGADGVGLLRTELSFLDRTAWPTVADHRRFLEPILTRLRGRPATVRLLDFGGDKTPPFLGSADGRGVELLLRHPAALRDQLAAVLAAGQGTDLRILVPMVLEARQLRSVREAIVETAATIAVGMPLIGAMIEVPGAAALVEQIVAEVDFLSIGTNDLTALQLGLERSQPGARPAHHPAVLRLVDEVCRAAGAAGISVAVCGEAASDPVAMPLLVGLGVDELSVGASRVGCVRGWVRALDHRSAATVAHLALEAGSAQDVEALARPLSATLLAS